MRGVLKFISHKYVSISLIAFFTYLFLRPSSGHSTGPINDKVAHAFIFICLYLSWSLFTKKPKMTFFVLFLYGCIIEFCQYLLPLTFHRGFELYDILADSFGLAIGFVIYYLTFSFISNKKG